MEQTMMQQGTVAKLTEQMHTPFVEDWPILENLTF
jgi:hypothetical protein